MPLEAAVTSARRLSASRRPARAWPVAPPPDLPEDVEVWDEGPLDGPDDVVVEVVSDTFFEGIRTAVAGTVGEQPFLVERFEDPQRVAIDVVHGG